jgi:hypothetical protein
MGFVYLRKGTYSSLPLELLLLESFEEELPFFSTFRGEFYSVETIEAFLQILLFFLMVWLTLETYTSFF